MKIVLKETLESRVLNISNVTCKLNEIIKKLDEECLEVEEAADDYMLDNGAENLTNLLGEMLDLGQMLAVLNKRLMNNANYKASLEKAYKNHHNKYDLRFWETGNEIEIIYKNKGEI